MATIDDTFKQYWHAYNAQIPYAPEHAIPTAWRQHYREWGPPMRKEVDLEDGGKAQVFVNCIVIWSGGDEVRVVE
jgi:hypothetical protein